MDKSRIMNNFSRYAHLYDRYAGIQSRAAFELAGRIEEDRFRSILEIGCGTGNYTLILRDKFRDAKLKTIDISDKMVEVAKNKLKDRAVKFIIADAEILDLGETFDLITSNATLQWFQDLEKALVKYRYILRENGIISFSIFGPLTFCELDTSLKYILKDNRIASAKFMTKERLRTALRDNFRCITIKEVRYKETFSNLRVLLEKIKYSGINGNGLNNRIYFSRVLLDKLEEVYLEKFKKIQATYQIFFCRGIR